jgi:hypothetical protein
MFIQSPATTALLVACSRMRPQTIQGWSRFGRRISSKITPAKRSQRIVKCSTNFCRVDATQSRQWTRSRRRTMSKHTASPFAAEQGAPSEFVAIGLDALCANFGDPLSAAWLDARPGTGTPPHSVHSPKYALPTPSTSSEEDYGHHLQSQLSAASSPSASRGNSPTPLDSDASSSSKRRKLSCLHGSCKRTFSDEYIREVHMLTHQTKGKKSFPCTFARCSQIFSRKHDRLRHEVLQHGKQCDWVCDRCRKFFACEKTLQKHHCGGSSGTRWVVPADGEILDNAEVDKS